MLERGSRDGGSADSSTPPFSLSTGNVVETSPSPHLHFLLPLGDWELPLPVQCGAVRVRGRAGTATVEAQSLPISPAGGTVAAAAVLLCL